MHIHGKDEQMSQNTHAQMLGALIFGVFLHKHLCARTQTCLTFCIFTIVDFILMQKRMSPKGGFVIFNSIQGTNLSQNMVKLVHTPTHILKQSEGGVTESDWDKRTFNTILQLCQK